MTRCLPLCNLQTLLGLTRTSERASEQASEREFLLTSLSLAQLAARGHSGDKAGDGQRHVRTSVIGGEHFSSCSFGHQSDMPVGGGGQEGRECPEKSHEVIGAPGFPRRPRASIVFLAWIPRGCTSAPTLAGIPGLDLHIFFYLKLWSDSQTGNILFVKRFEI